MGKRKAGTPFPNPKGHTGPMTQFRRVTRPAQGVMPRVVARTKAK
jgi:hypothetical protein